VHPKSTRSAPPRGATPSRAGVPSRTSVPARVDSPSLRSGLLAAAACALFGKLGLLLATAGPIAEVRPGAGIALACVLFAGPRVAPWILLGTALAHFGVGSLPVGASLGAAASIGVAEAVEALAAAALVRRFASFPTSFGEASGVVRFMLLGGPVAAVPGAAIATAALRLLGRIGSPDVAATFGSWWMGSAAGATVFGPLAILWLSSPLRAGLRRKLSVTAPLATILAFALVLFAQIGARERERVSADFDRRVDELANGLERSFDGSLDVLDSLGSFYDASRSVDRREFSAFARFALAHGGGVRSLAWCPRVRQSERAGCVRAGRLEVDPSFGLLEKNAAGALVPAAEHPEYFPAFYVETVGVSKRPRGIDAAADPERRTALERARDEGVPAATAPLALEDGSPGRTGVAVYRPVYGHGEPRGTPAERRKSLVGYVCAEVEVPEVVERAIEGSDLEGLRVELADVSEPARPTLLAARPAAIAAPGAGAAERAHRVGHRFAGRDWQLLFESRASALLPPRSRQSWLVLAGGLLFTALLEAFLLVGTGRSDAIEALVARRTAELEQANDHLRHEVAERARAETEHQSSEIRLAAAQALAHLGSWELDLEGRRVLWSDELHRILGLKPRSEPFSFEECLEKIHPEDRARVTAGLEASIRDRRTFATHLRIVRTDAVRTLHVRGEVVCDAAGRPFRVHGTGQDVTELKHAERELARRTQELERSNAELERFAYVASHDLQEPLRAVASHVQILEEDYKGRLDADADECIHCAVEGVQRMHALINDYLAYSRVRSATEELAPTPTGPALERALKNLERAIAESGAVVTHDAMPTVHADPVQVVQLFQNLVGNAVKFRGSDAPRVHVSAARAEAMCLFSVSDNGIGIDPEHTRKIFTIFQRLHTQDRYPGTGIGLAICKKIVDRHGGRIWVESMPGMGSTFRFTLPFAPEPALPSRPEASNGVSVSAESLLRGGAA
jgi:PAS domain S-box-containing protein